MCCSPEALLVTLAPPPLSSTAHCTTPDATTFRILTSALCCTQRPTAAADLLRCMPALLDPDPRHCRAVLASLCRFVPYPDALAFLDDMRRWGEPVGPQRRPRRTPAGGYQVVSKQMDSDGVPPGLPELEGVLHAFRKSGSLDAVEEAFDEMLLRGLVPTITIPSSAVS